MNTMSNPFHKNNFQFSDPPQHIGERVHRGLTRRYRREKIFKGLCITSMLAALLFLSFLFYTIIAHGYSAFEQTYISLDICLPRQAFAVENLAKVNYQKLIRDALYSKFPEITSQREKNNLAHLISNSAAFSLQDLITSTPSLIGSSIHLWVLADDDVDMFMKGKIDSTTPETDRRLSDRQLLWLQHLKESGTIKKRFNTLFFTSGDSREPEAAGILGAVKGSLYTILITLALSFPIGVAAAIYLEEFAPRNKFTSFIEININNLAAVPSIIFGLLGLAVFINFFGIPRSTPLVGGLVLTLMTLPTIIISSRASLKSVPSSLQEAALGLGASKLQTILHHVFPLALPGMLTGTIIGMAQALGETAPLLMIGMVAFIVDIPGSIVDPATALPVQIFLWSDSPERAFTERTSAAIIILLVFLIAMNGIAVFLRKKFETRW